MENFNNDAEKLKWYYWILIICLNLIICAFWNNYYELSATLSIGLLFIRPWVYKISNVAISDHELKVTKHNWLFGSKSYSFDLSRIDFNYRSRPVKLLMATMSKHSNKGNVLMLFCDEYFLFDLTPDENKWTDASIRRFAKELKAHNVKQMLEKYGSNDVLDY